jgi:restriction endonuclease S subunit
MIPTSNQDVREAKNRKREDEILKKSLKLLSQSQPNFAEVILEWSLSKSVSVISEPRPRWPPQPNLI